MMSKVTKYYQGNSNSRKKIRPRISPEEYDLVLNNRKKLEYKPVDSIDKLTDQIKKSIINKTYSVEELSDRFNVAPKEIKKRIELLKDEKYELEEIGNNVSISTSPKQGGNHVLNDDMWKGDYIRFGFTSDNHLGSHYERVDVLNLLYDIFEGENIPIVLNGGNWIDGEAHFNKNEIHTKGMTKQIEYAVKTYPFKKGIETWFVSGDDHEGWYCFEPNTEILSLEKGWIRFEDLDGHEHVATKNNNGEFEWQIPNKIIKNQFDGNLIHFKHRSIDILTTPYHRFECNTKSSLHGKKQLKVLTSEEIKNSFKSRCIGIPRTTDRWNGNIDDFIDIPIQPCRYTNHSKIYHPIKIDSYNLAMLCAWFVTEGSTNGNIVSIAQSLNINPNKVKLIESLLTNIGIKYSVNKDQIRFSSKDLAVYLNENCGVGFLNKKLPRWILDAPTKILKDVLDILILGDGNHRKNGSDRFYTGSKYLEAQVSEIAQKLGKTVSFIKGKGCVNISICNDFPVAWLFKKPTEVEYSGLTYCVSVDNQRIFVRKNGKSFWSMNCQREGINIGEYFQIKREQAGMFDMKHLGYVESDIAINDGKFEHESYIRVMHPGGGSAYATSYSAQKIVESLQGGEKPAALFIGHYHKMMYSQIRNVHTIQMGTTCDQTIFMRKKKIEAHVGGGIVTFRRSSDGTINRCMVEYITAFDRKFYIGKDKYWK